MTIDIPSDSAIGSDPATENSKPPKETKLRLAVDNPAPSSWRGKLIKSGGKPRKIMYNVKMALLHAPELQDALVYDAAALVTYVQRVLPWDDVNPELPFRPRPWTDNDDRELLMWLEYRDIPLSLRVVCEAVQSVASMRTFHPIIEYLDNITWDGVNRIDSWLIDYLGAEDTALNRAISARWLISAVARIYQPACQADCMMILEGPQGIGKSTALRILGGAWYTDEIRDLGRKDTSMSLAGKWIIEFSELEGFRGENVEKLKAFLSRSIDRFRPPYARSVVDVKRRCVFAGTTNNQETLRDTTGNRRFWPVLCATVKVAELTRDRDQLWAEAVARYRSASPWWMDTAELQAAVGEATTDRLDADPWEELIAIYTAHAKQVSTMEILENCLEVKASAISRRDTHRVSGVLKSLGFSRQKVREKKLTRWVFVRADEQNPQKSAT